MNVERILYKPARDEDVMDIYSQTYRDRTGLHLIEYKTVQYISDFPTARSYRESADNGKTWGEWKEIPQEQVFETQGENVRQLHKNISVWNPVHKHTIKTAAGPIFIGGEEVGAEAFWNDDPTHYGSHSYLDITDENGNTKRQMVRYEDGDEFDPNDFGKPSFYFFNRCYVNGNLLVEPNGDILFTGEVPMKTCCRLAGKDVEKVFPSKPNLMCGIIVFRGSWDGEKYNFTHGEPIVISDVHSSRGFNEPAMAKLKSGRIIVIMRGSNAYPFGNRIAPGTPGYKWMSFSDDGGKTFSDPMPWHFDNGEVIYSSATISYIHQDERTGDHYWIGNITGHEIHPVYSNFPRYPLCIVKMDEEYGWAKKDSYTVIDTRREDESEWVQLSNFTMLQNRETGNLEVMLNKIGHFAKTSPDEHVFRAPSWKYIIELE